MSPVWTAMARFQTGEVERESKLAREEVQVAEVESITDRATKSRLSSLELERQVDLLRLCRPGRKGTRVIIERCL